MVAGFVHRANEFVHPGTRHLLCDFGAHQEMVDAQARIAFEVISKVVPERVDRLVGRVLVERVGPALFEQPLVGVAAFGLQQRVLFPGRDGIDVGVRWHNVVVAGKHDGVPRLKQALRVLVEGLEPSELVIELRPGLRISVGQIQTSHQHAVRGRFKVAALLSRWVIGQAAANLQGLRPASKDGDAIPRFLPMNQSTVARLLNGVLREIRRPTFEFL